MSLPPAHVAYVGLGSNVGEPAANIASALAALARTPLTRLMSCSSLYRSAPIGYAAQADFVNAACCLQTALSAHELLGALQRIELDAGRRRDGIRFGPRTLDLDLLLFDDLRLDDARLALPHPRLHERRFALEPLAELCEGLDVPGRGNVGALLARCADQRVEKLDTPVAHR